MRIYEVDSYKNYTRFKKTMCLTLCRNQNGKINVNC